MGYCGIRLRLHMSVVKIYPGNDVGSLEICHLKNFTRNDLQPLIALNFGLYLNILKT